THHVETAFDLVRKGQVEPNHELIAIALVANDQMRCLIDTPAAAKGEDSDAIVRNLHAIVERGAAPAPVAAPAPTAAAPPPALTTWRIGFRLPRDAMAMGTNPLLLLDELRGLGACTVVARTADIPPLEQLNVGDCYLGWDVELVTDQPRPVIEQVFLFVLDD